MITKQKINLFLEENKPTDPQKWSYAVSQAKKKFDVYPSAYANAWAAKKYKELGGGWRKDENIVEEVPQLKKTYKMDEPDYEGEMAKSELLKAMKYSREIMDMLEDETELPAWIQSKITKIADYIGTVKHYLEGEIKHNK